MSSIGNSRLTLGNTENAKASSLEKYLLATALFIATAAGITYTYNHILPKLCPDNDVTTPHQPVSKAAETASLRWE